MKTIKELYQYRQMIFSLVRKDLRGRYKGSVLGFMWTFINPLLQLCIYTVVFSTIMRAGIDKFYVFLFVALVPWLFFSASLTNGSTVILVNQDLVKKIYSLLDTTFECNYTIEKVDGHSGNIGNEIADAVATRNKVKLNKFLEKYEREVCNF